MADTFKFVKCIQDCYIDGIEFNTHNINYNKARVIKGACYYATNRRKDDNHNTFVDIYDIEQPMSDDTFIGSFPDTVFKKASTHEIFEYFNIEDNPFDVMYSMALELTRAIMFEMHRCGVEGLEMAAMTTETLDFYIESIKTQFDIIHKLPADVKEICRSTSLYGEKNFKDINDYIFKIEKNIDIKRKQAVPVRNIRFEEAKLGEGSEKYLRLRHLRNYKPIKETLYKLTKKELYRLIEYIDLINETNKESRHEKMVNFNNGNGFELSYGVCKDLVDKFSLTIDDIMYIIRYKDKKEEE